MEQKRVTFEVAKAIKEAGYPQFKAPCYITENCTIEYDSDYDGDMPIVHKNTYTEGQYIHVFGRSDKECDPPRCYAPTYLEVWLWLWREKGYRIREEITKITIYNNSGFGLSAQLDNLTNDPEEAIEAAIEYLIDNGLLK